MTAQPIQLPSLADLLATIEENETNHDVRHGAVLMAVAVAQHAGYTSGFRIDPDEPDWPVAYIQLPTGQVSWHTPLHPYAYDGHDTPEKYRRCRAFSAEAERVAEYEALLQQGWSDYEARDIVWPD